MQFGPLGHKIGRWLSSLLGLVIIGFALLTASGYDVSLLKFM